MNKNKIRFFLPLILIIFFMIFYIVPILWMIITSFQPQGLLATVPPEVSFEEITFKYYKDLFTSSSFLNALRNTFIITVISTFLTVAFASMGAYAVTRLTFPGRSFFLFSGLSMQMFPAVTFLIPLFVILQKIRLIDNIIGVVLVFLVFICPVAMLLLIGFFKSVPKELEEAAFIDGCSRFYTFYKIVLPIVKPGLLAAAVFVFISVWGDLLIPLTLTVSKSTTLTVFSSAFSGIYEINFGGAAAVSVFSAIPTIIVMLVFRNYLIKGLVEGSLKG